jgi:hypothetical protein
MKRDAAGAGERLDTFIGDLRQRLSLLIYTRAAAVAFVAVLAITCSAIVLLARSGFSSYVTLVARTVLGLSLAASVVLLLWLPFRKLRSGGGAAELERRLPDQQGRIQTWLDIRRREALGERTPFADLLAEDAVRLTDEHSLERVVPRKWLWTVAVAAGAALLALIGMLTMGRGEWGYGSRHLLLGAEIPREVIPERIITVKPGGTTVRRNSDLSIVANMQGFAPAQADVYVRFDDEQSWQKAPMQSQADRDGRESWAFRLYALRGPLHYYVAAGDTRSPEHKVGVADLPKIEKVRLTYSYPQWTGLKAQTDEAQRDIRAVAETEVKVEVFADKNLEAPALVVDGKPNEISAVGATGVGTLTVSKPGDYYIGAKVLDEFVALTEDYTIEVIEDAKPTIEIVKPGRDWRATNIEEVPVRVRAEDDFRLQDVELRYAVNGGKWQAVNLDAGSRETNDESMLRMEDLGTLQHSLDAKLPGQLVPGDLVSYYAVAKDRSKQVQTDLFMVQVQPFERRFTQNQAAGGGGGGGGDDEQGAISERQKEILLATWNLQRSDNNPNGAKKTRQQLVENASMLAELQTTLATQARTVAERTRARVSLDEDEHVKAFVEAMEAAAKVMEPAAQRLKEFKLADAVPIEQQALQQLLRAESAFRDVQVSMQQRSASSGGGSEAARNFSEMFELEMDLEKNQYETQSQLSQESRQQELDDVLRRLKELAERQEKLAQQANRDAIAMKEQRWRQEQLRREAEDLKRRLAELAKEQQGQTSPGAQSGDPNAAGQSSGESSDERMANGTNNGQQSERRSGNKRDERTRKQLEETIKSLNKALDEMRAANGGASGKEGSDKNSQPSGQQQDKPGAQAGQSGEDGQSRSASTQSAEQAGRNLRQAVKQMDLPTEKGLGESVSQLADRAQQLTDEQRGIESSMRDALNEATEMNRRRGSLDPKRARALYEAKQKMMRELAHVQGEMRDAAHENRNDAPAATKRLVESLSELENSSAMARIGRSADEILYGRARDAAAREGLIEEALETLEKGLRESATLAAQGRDKPRDEATPEQMLARIAELRRALQQAQSQSGERGGSSSQQRGSSSQDRNDQPGNSQARSSQSGQPDGGPNDGGLTAWNPGTPNGSLWNRETGAGSYREARELSEDMRRLADRLGGREWTAAEINSLRGMTRDLRRLADDPLATEAQAMAQLIDKIELAALAAAEKSKDRSPSRTTVQNTDSPEYRDAVAEYYRRLGGARAGPSP